MAVKKKNAQTIVLDHSQMGEVDLLTTADYAGHPPTTDFADDTDASLCPNCGEPLAWHDEACAVSQAPPATQPEEPAPTAGAVQSLTPSPFAYALGQPVQPAPDAQPCPIIWRGQLKAPHPRTGLVHRINVYRLDNGYWDCYYEAELAAA